MGACIEVRKGGGGKGAGGEAAMPCEPGLEFRRGTQLKNKCEKNRRDRSIKLTKQQQEETIIFESKAFNNVREGLRTGPTGKLISPVKRSFFERWGYSFRVPSGCLHSAAAAVRDFPEAPKGSLPRDGKRSRYCRGPSAVRCLARLQHPRYSGTPHCSGHRMCFFFSCYILRRKRKNKFKLTIRDKP